MPAAPIFSYLAEVNETLNQPTNPMKHISFTLLALFLLTTTFAQQDYLDTIAEKSCECIEKENLVEKYQGEQLTMQLGICLITASREYRAELLRDHEINFDRIHIEGEKLGLLIGGRMALVCPDFLVSAAGETSEDGYTYYAETGTITGITEKPFVMFTIKNDQGRTSDYYWLTFIESGLDLQHNYGQLKGKKVNVEFLEEELFDPRIKDYRYFNHLTSIELVE